MQRIRRAATTTGFRRDALLWALALMVLTYVWRVQDLFPLIGRISPALTVTGAAMALWFLDTDPRRRLHHIDTPTLRVLLGLTFCMLVSIPDSLWIGNSVRFLYQDFAMTLVFLFLIAVAIRGTRDLEWFAWLHLLGAVMYSVVVLAKGKVSVDGRLSGMTYYDANDLALVLVCTLPFAVYFLRKEVAPRMRLAALVGFIILTLTIVKTGSRGGFLGLVAAMGYILFHYRAISKRARLTAAVVAGLVLMVVGSETYWTRIQTLLRPQEDYNLSENNLSGRMAVWKRGVGYMAARPLYGVGVRNFAQAEGRFSQVGLERAALGQGFKWSAPHNSFVEIGAELGLPALVLFVVALVGSIRLMRRLGGLASPGGPVPPEDGAFAQALIGSILAFMVSGFFLSQAYSAYLYTLFALVIGITKLHRPALLAAQARPPAGRTARGRGRGSAPRVWTTAPGNPHP